MSPMNLWCWICVGTLSPPVTKGNLLSLKTITSSEIKALFLIWILQFCSRFNLTHFDKMKGILHVNILVLWSADLHCCWTKTRYNWFNFTVSKHARYENNILIYLVGERLDRGCNRRKTGWHPLSVPQWPAGNEQQEQSSGEVRKLFIRTLKNILIRPERQRSKSQGPKAPKRFFHSSQNCSRLYLDVGCFDFTLSSDLFLCYPHPLLFPSAVSLLCTWLRVMCCGWV